VCETVVAVPRDEKGRSATLQLKTAIRRSLDRATSQYKKMNGGFWHTAPARNPARDIVGQGSQLLVGLTKPKPNSTPTLGARDVFSQFPTSLPIANMPRPTAD